MRQNCRFVHGVLSLMFRSLFTTLSICLQGTPFQQKHKQKGKEKMPVTWAAEEETDAIDEKTPAGYLMVSGEHQLKNDLITKLTCVDNRLLGGRAQSKKGRAHWCPNIHQQDYLGGAKEVSSDPQVEVYWKALGLSQTAPTEELDW